MSVSDPPTKDFNASFALLLRTAVLFHILFLVQSPNLAAPPAEQKASRTNQSADIKMLYRLLSWGEISLANDLLQQLALECAPEFKDHLRLAELRCQDLISKRLAKREAQAIIAYQDFLKSKKLRPELALQVHIWLGESSLRKLSQLSDLNEKHAQLETAIRHGRLALELADKKDSLAAEALGLWALLCLQKGWKIECSSTLAKMSKAPEAECSRFYWLSARLAQLDGSSPEQISRIYWLAMSQLEQERLEVRNTLRSWRGRSQARLESTTRSSSQRSLPISDAAFCQLHILAYKDACLHEISRDRIWRALYYVELARARSNQRSAPSPLDLFWTQKKLDADEARFVLFDTGQGLAVWSLEQASLRFSLVKTANSALFHSLATPFNEFNDRPEELLAKALMDLSSLPKWTLAPFAELRLIPYDLLPVNDSPLISRVEISFCDRVTSRLMKENPTLSGSSLAMLNPATDYTVNGKSEFPDLVHAADGVQILADFFQQQDSIDGSKQMPEQQMQLPTPTADKKQPQASQLTSELPQSRPINLASQEHAAGKASDGTIDPDWLWDAKAKLRFQNSKALLELAEHSKANQALLFRDSFRILLGPNASELLFTRFAPQSAFIHLACHGEFDILRPWQSSLYLARTSSQEHSNQAAHGQAFELALPTDGILRAHEIRDLGLSNLKFIALAGCETGLSSAQQADSLAGFPRAFMTAGAKQILASLWKVEDEQTSVFMEQFYKQLTSGLSASAALRATKLLAIEAEQNQVLSRQDQKAFSKTIASSQQALEAFRNSQANRPNWAAWVLYRNSLDNRNGWQKRADIKQPQIQSKPASQKQKELRPQ